MQGLLETVHLNVYVVPAVPVNVEVALVGAVIVPPVPDTTLQAPVPIEGALPASFSKECYEDLLAFKSQLIAAYSKRQAKEEAPRGSTISLTLLSLTEQGTPDPRAVEIMP